MNQHSRKTPIFASLLAVALGFAGASARAQTLESVFGVNSASVTYGPYVRLELGGAATSADEATWLPPGAGDPRILFDAEAGDAGWGAIAFGHDWQNGLRADLAFFGTGTSGVAAPCASASDGSPCSTHADITDASVSSRGLMANLFYAPLEARGSNALFQPFVVAGLGFAVNEVGVWTRENPASTSPVRRYSGDRSTELAWSLGVGAALQVTRPGQWPIIVEASWRYYDFGSAPGGTTPLPGFGNSEPRQPFTFDHTSQVITLGVRIPLRRY